MNSKLIHHLLPMFLDGFDANAQLGRNLLVGSALRYQLQDFSFPGGEIITTPLDGLAGDKGFAAVIAQAFGNGRTEISVAAESLAYGLKQIRGGGLFDQVPGGARFS